MAQARTIPCVALCLSYLLLPTISHEPSLVSSSAPSSAMPLQVKFRRLQKCGGGVDRPRWSGCFGGAKLFSSRVSSDCWAMLSSRLNLAVWAPHSVCNELVNDRLRTRVDLLQYKSYPETLALAKAIVILAGGKLLKVALIVVPAAFVRVVWIYLSILHT